MSGAILSGELIKNEITNGNITIEPCDFSRIGPASYELTLSNEFRTYLTSWERKGLDGSDIIIDENTDYKDHTKKVLVDDFMDVPSKTSILGITEEKITLPPNICGLLNGRSRFARMGIFIHITAFFINPGGSNRLVLEIFNSSPYTLRLKPGTKIAQLIFVNMIGDGEYKGKYQNQVL